MSSETEKKIETGSQKSEKGSAKRQKEKITKEPEETNSDPKSEQLTKTTIDDELDEEEHPDEYCTSDISEEQESKSNTRKILNENLFYFRSYANKEDLFFNLSQYCQNSQKDIGIIKPLRKKNNINKYSTGTLVLMKKEIYERNKDNEKFRNTFFNIAPYVYNPKIEEQYGNNKKLFLKLPYEVPNYVCAKKIEELVSIFEHFELLEKDSVTISIAASNRISERFEKTKYGSIEFSKGTPFSSIECFRVLLNMLDIEYHVTGKLAMILCKYDEGKKNNPKNKQSNRKKHEHGYNGKLHEETPNSLPRRREKRNN